MVGRQLYAKRTCTVKPVLGIIEMILGFRQLTAEIRKHQGRVQSDRDGVEFEAKCLYWQGNIKKQAKSEL